MSTKPRIIAEDVLLPTHFLSATEQEGTYLNQPEPDNDNSGSLRPISAGDNFASMALNGTVASGAHATIFRTTGFDIYGDDYFIGCKIKTLEQFVDSGNTGHKVVSHGVLSVIDEKRFGNHGLKFDGSASFISIAHHANWSSLQPDYSIDLRAKHTDHSGDEYYVHQYKDINNRWLFRRNDSDGLSFIMVFGGVNIIAAVGGAANDITDSDWHHLLMVKVGNEYGIYLDGNQISYLNDASMATFTGPLEIGRYGGGSNYFDGNMDEVRIYHGNPLNAAPNAGITDTITVPTAPHESDSDTWLLLHGGLKEREITDFDQPDGKITYLSTFGANLATGETFQIARDKNDVDFRLQLTHSGDVGTAKFKWSHDGGTTYLGRNEATASNWLAEVIVDNSDPAIVGTALCQAQNGDWLVFGNDNAGYPFVRISSDNGKTWGSRIQIVATAYEVEKALTPKSGRVLILTPKLYYSDDNGLTWSDGITTTGTGGFNTGMVELKNGNIIIAYNDGTDVKTIISYDGGMTWSSLSTVSAAANTQAQGCLAQAKNGDVICAYSSDEDSLNDLMIKCKISDDGGVTWGAAKDVIDFVEDFEYPDIAMDIDGTIYITCDRDTGDRQISFTYSDDNGVSWNEATRKQTLVQKAGTDLQSSAIALIDNQLVCSYIDMAGTDTIKIVRRGMWELCATQATNACPCAIESYEQSLICGAKIKWAGYAGITGDKWTFGPEYYYAKENLLLDSPSLPWRSEQDNVEVSIVIALVTLEGHLFNSIGLFGCNIRTLKIQASPVNETKGWILPPVDEDISFDIDTTGVVDSVTSNYIEDAALLADYKDHELRNHYIRMTSGPDNGVTYKIANNIGDRFEIRSAEMIKAIAGDTFAIFKPDISAFFTDPDTNDWADLGSLQISGSNNNVQEQDIAGNLHITGSAASNVLARVLVGGWVSLSSNSHDNCITGLQCTGNIEDLGTNNVVEEGGWHNYPYRYIRILIELQDTYEGYYQIGNMVLDKYTELTRNWRIGYNVDSNFGVEVIRTPHGGLTPIRKHDEIKKFNLSWHQIDETNTELTKLIDYVGGKNVCLIPDGDDPTDCYLTKFVGVVKHRHVRLDRFDTNLVMEEVK